MQRSGRTPAHAAVHGPEGTDRHPRSSVVQTNARLQIVHGERSSPPCTVFRQNFVSQAFQQVLRFRTGKQLGPLPLRIQFSQQEASEPVLFHLWELGGSLKGPLKKLVHLLSPVSREFGTAESYFSQGYQLPMADIGEPRLGSGSHRTEQADQACRGRAGPRKYPKVRENLPWLSVFPRRIPRRHRNAALLHHYDDIMM